MSVPITFGILTVSDSCHENPLNDKSGPQLKEEITNYFPNSKISVMKIVPDDSAEIANMLAEWSDNQRCNVILTTGGTGLSKRDVTPEATRLVIEREAPGLSFAMIANSLKITPMAMLSRAVCGIRSETLIINLPGSQKGAAECFGFIKSTLPHAVALLTDQKRLIRTLHDSIQNRGGGDTKEHFENSKFISSKVKLNVAKRDRKSPYPMIEVSEAERLVLTKCSPTEDTEIIPFEKSVNHILAEDIFALRPVPPFRASIKDGYAVRAEDGIGIRCVVTEVAAAGDKPFQEEVKKGEAVRISTGAALPPGADAVVQVEDTTLCETSDDGTVEVLIKVEVAPKINQDIREVGSDVPQNSLVLNKYQRIQPSTVGVFAMLGKTEVKVFKRKSIGIISTGNELTSPRDTPDSGKIRDANKYTLMNILEKYSYRSTDCGIAKDNPDAVKNVIEEACTHNDVIITSGGVSMGEFDVLKQVLIEDFRAKIHFARVNMKPGKPTTFATFEYRGKRKIFFGLPGNPVSCGVTCLLYVVPALRYMERDSNFRWPKVRAKAPNLKNMDQRPEYHRVQVRINPDSGDFEASSTGNQISSRLNSLVGANGLALVRQHDDTLEYEVILFDSVIG